MLFNKKLIYSLIALITLAWTFNIILYHSTKLDGPLFTYTFTDREGYQLSYILDQDDKDKVYSVSFPELNDNEYIINYNDNFNSLMFTQQEESRFSDKSPRYNKYYFQTFYTNHSSESRFLGSKDIFTKPITKLKYTTYSGKTGETNIGYLIPYSGNYEDNKNQRPYQLYYNCGNFSENNKTIYSYDANDNISITSIDGIFKDNFLKYNELYFNDNLIESFPINIKKGDSFTITRKGTKLPPSYENYDCYITLTVSDPEGSTELIPIHFYSNYEYHPYTIKDVMELKKLGGIQYE